MANGGVHGGGASPGWLSSAAHAAAAIRGPFPLGALIILALGGIAGLGYRTPSGVLITSLAVPLLVFALIPWETLIAQIPLVAGVVLILLALLPFAGIAAAVAMSKDVSDGFVPRRPTATPCLHTKEVAARKTVSVNKFGSGDKWETRGGDGFGGTLLSFDLTVDGTINNVAMTECSGCGGHTWLCPEAGARCQGHKLLETVGEGTWRAWAATDDGTNATTKFDISYTRKEQVAGACP